MRETRLALADARPPAVSSESRRSGESTSALRVQQRVHVPRPSLAPTRVANPRKTVHTGARGSWCVWLCLRVRVARPKRTRCPRCAAVSAQRIRAFLMFPAQHRGGSYIGGRPRRTSRSGPLPPPNNPTLSMERLLTDSLGIGGGDGDRGLTYGRLELRPRLGRAPSLPRPRDDGLTPPSAARTSVVADRGRSRLRATPMAAPLSLSSCHTAHKASVCERALLLSHGRSWW